MSTQTTTTQAASGAEGGEKALWYMHVAGPDDVHAAPDFWTALAWAAELNGFIAARAAKENWAADDNWPLTQATVRRWPWPVEQHATLLARELADRREHEERRKAAGPANQAIFDAVLAIAKESVRIGAPGLSPELQTGVARSIAMKASRAPALTTGAAR